MLHIALACLIVLWVAEGATGERCQGAEFYVLPNGRDYRGTLNVTSSGIPCQKWSSQIPHAHETLYPDPSLGIGDNNFCRNPFGDATVGCFTMSPDVAYESCDIGAPCAATAAPTQSTLVYSIPDQTTVPFGTYLCVSCNGACDIYYTLDGSVPSRTHGNLYEHCFVLLTAVRVRSVAYTIGGSILIGDKQYNVGPQVTSGTLFPPPGLYTAPVMLFVRNGTSVLQANLFVPGALSPVAVGVSGLWLSTSGYVAAVVNGTLVAYGQYNFSIPDPQPPVIFPSSGTFFGGVRCLLFPLPRVAAVYVAFNQSSYVEWTLEYIALSLVGTTSVHVKAVYFDGTESTAVFSLSVVSDPAAACVPPPGTYTSIINVSCTAPSGAASIVPQWLNASPRPFVLLSDPGQYNLTVLFSDDTGFITTESVLYTLTPQSLPVPEVQPCGGAFAFLGAALSVQASGGSLQLAAQPGGNATMSNDRVYVTVATPSIVTLLARSNPINDTMLSSSLTTNCTFEFYGSGPYSTSSFQTSVAVDLSALASCLSLTSVAALQSTQVGVNMVVAVPSLPMQLVSTYNERLRYCLQLQGPTMDVFSAVTQFRVSSNTTTVGLPVRVSVDGVRLCDSAIKMVRDVFSCGDIGTLLAWGSDCASSTFIPAAAGSYRLCAISGGQSYGVPGPILTVATSRSSAAVVPCGGLVVTSLSASINAADGTLISVNGGPWYSAATLTIDRTNLPAVVTAANGAATVTCIFFGRSSLPEGLAYDATPLGGEVSIIFNGNVTSNSPLVMSVRSSNCSSPPTTVVSATSLSTSTVKPDDNIAGALPDFPVVCLSNAEWSVEVPPSGLVLSSILLMMVPSVLCSSGYAFQNATCACTTNDNSYSACASSLNIAPQDDVNSPTWVRVLMLVLYAAALVAVWIVFKGRTGKES